MKKVLGMAGILLQSVHTHTARAHAHAHAQTDNTRRVVNGLEPPAPACLSTHTYTEEVLTGLNPSTFPRIHWT